ncbi:MAG TPA: aspartate 1-decarboxylase [Sedimentisphaerales bacterium]|nr:aspartate 1-decarboxylase [Sedimentisphaerales bacterium]
MLIKILKGKLHRARVTDAKLGYAGSILIDSSLMEAAGILPYESVLVSDITNGNRLETYAVAAEANSGQVVVLGAAAQLIKAGDIIIIFSFAYCTNEEVKTLKPKVIVLDENNKIKTADKNS